MKKGMLLVCILVLMLLLAVGYWWYKQMQEHFESYPSVEERVIEMYREILLREPTSKELINSARDIKGDVLTWDGLRQQLMDRDEYSFNIKLQSNSLTPELNKMIAESRIIREMAKLYQEARGEPMPKELILPLRDLYISLNYNPFAFIAMLKDEKYANFEEDLSREDGLDKTKTLDAFVATFDQVKLTEKATEMSKEPGAKNVIMMLETNVSPVTQQVMQESPNLTVGEQERLRNMLTAYPDIGKIKEPTPTATSELNNVMMTASEVGKNDRPIDQPDTDMTSQLEDIMRPRTHEGDMVLRPEFSWAVPQKQPPVCTMPGQPAPVQPVLVDSKLMLGTPLCEANQTQVGSIMPKFEFKQES